MATFPRTRYLCHALTAAATSQVSTVSTLAQKLSVSPSNQWTPPNVEKQDDNQIWWSKDY
jgi:hypothetical protein